MLGHQGFQNNRRGDMIEVFDMKGNDDGGGALYIGMFKLKGLYMLRGVYPNFDTSGIRNTLF